MRKFIPLFLLISIIFMVACGDVVVEKTAPTPNPFPTDGSIPEDLIIRINRTPCFKACPAYLLTVKADGKVKFFGQQFTKVQGQQDGEIDEAKIKQLIAEFEKANFFSFEDRYASKNCEEHSPTVRTTLFINGKTKKIEHDRGCDAPKELTALEDKIDEIVGTSKWIGEQK